MAGAAGVSEGQTEVSSGGIGGFFGGKEKMKTYAADTHYDPNYDKNSHITSAMAEKVNKRQFTGMGGAQVGPAAQIDTGHGSVIDGQRNRQNAMLDQMQAAAAGKGPSAAQAQLKTGADRAMASNLAMAAAGGTPASMRQAAFNNAAAQQDLAGQSAALRAQEMQQAQGMYADSVAGARGLDAQIATNQAGLNQQTQLAQAGFNQDTAKTNLVAQQEFQKQKDDMVKQYLLTGMTLDQANAQTEIQQRQFNAGLAAQQEAAGRGVSAQNAGQSAQTVGAIASTLGTIAAAASDKRAKKNVTDADKDVEKFLDGIAAKSWDYKDPAKHGEGRRTGIMAQDAEKNSGMVFEHPDGTKMIDHSKAISTSMASLANLNARLRKLEGSKRA
jgi:hypothetical protein